MAGEGAPRVAAIVLNCNGRDITLQALASLEPVLGPAFARLSLFLTSDARRCRSPGRRRG